MSRTRTPARHAARAAKDQQPLLDAATVDSFQNFAANMGLGTDNITSGSSYGFNPITRDRVKLEWIHRGSWVGGIAVDVIADDMTRAGVAVTGLSHPSEGEELQTEATRLSIWKKINETIKWSRLYGGAMAVMLVDGQDLRTPLRLETVGPGDFKGLMVLDRYQVEPTLSDLVDEYGPDMGMPRFYKVSSNAPGLIGKTIHYSRILRLDGVTLPWNQKLMENLWGISVLERLYDRMVAFDSATTGAAQLVYKSYIRTLKINGYKEMMGENGAAAQGVARYIEMMRRFQSVEGLNLIDAKDSYEVMPAPGFGGLAEAIMQFGQQLSGALQVPLVRLFGQSPAGLNASGESDMRTYYDGIKHRQEEQLLTVVTRIYRAMARSLGIDTEIGIAFNPLWQLTEPEKADIANKDSSTLRELFNDGLIGRGTALRELRKSGAVSGRFTTISDEMITEADEEGPPIPEALEVAEARHGELPAGQPEPTPMPPVPAPAPVGAK